MNSHPLNDHLDRIDFDKIAVPKEEINRAAIEKIQKELDNIKAAMLRVAEAMRKTSFMFDAGNEILALLEETKKDPTHNE